MPPTSNIRKTSTTMTSLTYVDDPSSAPRRTTSGRAVRANTTRPSNYYARPYASFAAAAANGVDGDVQNQQPAGFFPALQYFSDGITSLPKEVMRQFTLLKEVEAKVHGPNERLGEMVDEIMQFPVPSQKSAHGAVAGDRHGLLSFTANNSATGSANVSLLNGNAPNANNISARNSISGSVNGEETAQTGNGEDLERRRKFHELRALTHNLLPNLDEKNVVLAEANRVLAQQLMSLDSVTPYINLEVSEEARLGSMTHWAYSDNRQKKQAGTMANRRDVAATHSLAAAASAIHESDIAQARRDATRETTREKHKGRARDIVDSDFEERPRKAQTKVAKIVKSKANAQGLGIPTTGEPVKKRKLDKGAAAVGIERTASGMPKAVRGLKEMSRSIPTVETVKKAAKAKPGPPPGKKKGPNSAQGSPALASSPLHSSFSAALVEPPKWRPQSARIRQNSTATNLRHEQLADQEDETTRPTSAPSRVNGDRVGSKRKATDDVVETSELDRAIRAAEREDSMKQEEADAGDRPHMSRSTSHSGKAGRGSGAATPRHESISDPSGAIRARSTRSMRGKDDESSTEPQGFRKHQRKHSHLVKQLAPFNRSPDLNRVRVDDMDDDLESGEERPPATQEEAENSSHSPNKRQSRSRRNTGNLLAASSPPTYDQVDGDEDAIMIEEADPSAEPEEPFEEVPDLESDTLPLDGDADIEDDEDSEPGDPDDPNEPKYCYCNRGSYGEMIACDNEACPREWFHLECTGLREPPDEDVKWYCDECKPLFTAKQGRGKGRGGGRKREQ